MVFKRLILSISLLFLIIFLFSLNNSFNYLDPDLGWHLKAGEDIVKQKEVNTNNYYNYTLEDVDWVNHEWLLDVLSYIVYDNLGYIFLSLIFSLALVFVFYFLYKLLKSKYPSLKDKKVLSFNLSLFLYFLFSIIGIIAISPHVGLRMQVFALLLFTILLFILEKINQNYQRYYFALPLIFLIWANIHGTFLLGLGLIISFLGIKILERILYNYNFKKINYSYLWNNKKIKNFFYLIIVSILFTFINPYGLNLYKFLGGYKNTFYLNHISEWLSQYTAPFNFWQIGYLALTISLLLIPYLLDKYRNIKFNLWDVFLFVFFFYFAVSSRRHFPLFFIATLSSVIYLVNYLFIDNKKIFTYAYLRNKIDIKFLRAFIIFMVFLTSIFLLVQIDFTNKPFFNYCEKYPCEAVDFLQKNKELQDKKMFNYYTWGGYLIWNLPQKKLFIDGRMPQVEYKEHTILEDYFSFFNKDKIENKIKEHDIKLFLLSNNLEPKKRSWLEEKIVNLENTDNKNYLYSYLKNSNNWDLIFNNDVSVIYLKK